MEYLELGYNKLMVKDVPVSEQMASNDFDLFVESIAANKINQGVSENKKIKIDYDTGDIERKLGNTTRYVLGSFDDGTFGLRVFDASGTLVIDQSA